MDNKGRVTIPAKFRPKLADGLVITKGLDNCLFVYPIDYWKKRAERLTKLDLTFDQSIKLNYFWFGRAADCHLDQQGRVLIPPDLRKYASLNSDVMIIGLYTYFAIWSKENWEKVEPEIEQIGLRITREMRNFEI
jgi:MraZ protein